MTLRDIPYASGSSIITIRYMSRPLHLGSGS